MLERRQSAPFKVEGVVVGIVIDNRDPDRHYRVKVKYPWVSEAGQYTDAADPEDFRSTWCRLTSFFAGPQRGAFWLPEVDDEVLIAFEHGDVRRPFVIGALWNGVDRPTHHNDGQDGHNAFRDIRSRSGHMLQFVDDAPGHTERVVLQTLVAPADTEKPPRERSGHWICLDQSGDVDQIEIYDHTQEHYILLDTKAKKITIECKTGDMLLKAEKTLTLACQDLVLQASASIKAESGQATELTAGATMDVKSSATMTLNGATIHLN